jgi:hypothetical protein
MAGTTIRLEHTSVFGPEVSAVLQALQKAIEDRKALERYKALVDGEAYLLAELPVG